MDTNHGIDPTRFQKALRVLQDCANRSHQYDSKSLSEEESKAFGELVKLCKMIADDYSELTGVEHD